MTAAARSVWLFGLYLLVLGAGLVLAPNLVLAPFGIPPTQEVWLRVVGMLVLIIGSYYVVAGRAGLLPILRATVPARCAVMGFFAAFVVLGLGPTPLLMFGAVDVAGAVWTWLALRGEVTPSQAAAA